MKKITLEPLNESNWLKICQLTVSTQQKEYFPVPNVYWIGISRYEEHTELSAIKLDEHYIGLIGFGYDEDGVSGYINPLMIDEKHQGNHYAGKALELCVDVLKTKLKVSVINLGHRKNNVSAACLYEKYGFKICGEDERDYFRKLDLSCEVNKKSVKVETKNIWGKTMNKLEGIEL